jgi:hypothetical protein
MKWNILVGSLILGLGICTQGFGFELLDRMIGSCGCESSCCETKCGRAHGRGCCEKKCCDPAPKCCAPANGCCEKKCGARDRGCCEKKCCGNGNGNGCCEKKCCGRTRGCCEKKCCGNGNGNGCCEKKCCGNGNGCAPKCGCEQKCGKSKCHRGCLLDRIFACNKCCHSHNRCGCESACGGEIEMNGGDDMGPMPPAPVVDPSAFLPSPRTVVSANLVR